MHVLVIDLRCALVFCERVTYEMIVGNRASSFRLRAIVGYEIETWGFQDSEQ